MAGSMFPVTHKSARFCLGFVAIWGIVALAAGPQVPPPPVNPPPPPPVITDITAESPPSKRRRLMLEA